MVIMEEEKGRNLRRIIGLLATIYYAFLLQMSDGESCPVMKEARTFCLDRSQPQNQSACESAGCCWDETSNTYETKCYAKECKLGYFGWQCRSQCHCEGGVNARCNRYTGECEHGCVPGRWGVGCLLDSECTYNDPIGIYYTGEKSITIDNRPCVNWSLQNIFVAREFPDKDIIKAGSNCRNPRNEENRTWCYWDFPNVTDRKWGYCTLQKCGRFGINCVNECHCPNGDYCNFTTGICSSGRCDAHWTGINCQECSNGFFGITCESKCRCNSSTEVCDKRTGHCESGCAPGWQGQDCQTGQHSSTDTRNYVSRTTNVFKSNSDLGTLLQSSLAVTEYTTALTTDIAEEPQPHNASLGLLHLFIGTSLGLVIIVAVVLIIVCLKRRNKKAIEAAPDGNYEDLERPTSRNEYEVLQLQQTDNSVNPVLADNNYMQLIDGSPVLTDYVNVDGLQYEEIEDQNVS